MQYLTPLLTAPQAAYVYVHKTLWAIPRELWGLIGLIVCIACFVSYVMGCYQESMPNEWLIVIKDGKQSKAGIGLKTFVMPNESVVKFPSVMQRVTFKAMNVTKEMQGVSIEGEAFWQVDPKEDGPFRCYKYMEGGSANNNVGMLCESIVRNELANSHLHDVLTKRDQIRDNIRAEVAPQLKGWGVQLETVELTEVKICSGKLFEDLQAEFRQETSLLANQKKISANEQLTKNKLESEIKMTKTEEENTTQKQIQTNTQELRRRSQQADFHEKECVLDKKKVENDAQLTIARLQKEFEVMKQTTMNQDKINQEKKDYEFEVAKREIQLAKLHTPQTLEKYLLDSNDRIYRQIRFGETRVNQFVDAHDEKAMSLAALVPGMLTIGGTIDKKQ